ncbi:MAG: AAC(3) family N-acetyltransferase [Lentisphaerae bacterium]|nr:AAC(3) family N-acetyltransferase [Lentisphaerota bacterium]
MLKQSDIADSLRSMGLENGDIVLLHSSLISLGKVDGGPAAVIDAFLEVLGEDGTLLVPVFGALGILTDEVKNRPNAVISPCPVGTLAAIGKDAEALCKDHWKAETAHGHDTPFTRIAERNGYICLLGVDQDRNTTLHSVEALLELPYMNTATRTFTTPEGEEVTKSWKFYPGPHRDFIGLDPLLEPAMTRSRIGNAEVRLIRAREMYEIALAVGSSDPAFVLCNNPACADCVRQRAAIFADRIDNKESFMLAASSRLAGRYVPEMIENLKRCGVKYIELDYIQGKAWYSWSAEKLTGWANELAAENIEISAGRVFSVPEDAQKLVDLAAAAGIKKLIMPLNDSINAACAAINGGLQVDFFNTNQGAVCAAGKLNRHRAAASNDCSMVFNPAGFVLAGEMPFLQSYKLGRFIKTICQLDLVDQTWDGRAAALAQGNGEVKELISILRCHNFSGFMTLGGGAAYPGGLADAVGNFTALLDNM